jgi:hypothetical protein
MIEIVLFQALQDVKNLELPPGISGSGTKFEDYMVQQLYLRLHQQGVFAVFPPRYTLREATYSGIAHQFDVVIRQSELIAVECKFREAARIDELFAFRGKLIDYRKPPRGIFMTTAKHVNDHVFWYAISHHILIVSLFLPPVEYMIYRVKNNTDFARHLASLQARLREENTPQHLLVEWKNDHTRFVQEGYL